MIELPVYNKEGKQVDTFAIDEAQFMERTGFQRKRNLTQHFRAGAIAHADILEPNGVIK